MSKDLDVTYQKKQLPHQRNQQVNTVYPIFILALFPACLWHLVLGLLPLGWLLLSITFLICDLVNKRRDKLQVSALYVIKILFGLIFMIAPAAAIGLHMTDDSYVDVKSGLFIEDTIFSITFNQKQLYLFGVNRRHCVQLSFPIVFYQIRLTWITMPCFFHLVTVLRGSYRYLIF